MGIVRLVKHTAADRAKRKVNYRQADGREWPRCWRCREFVRISICGDDGEHQMALRCEQVGTGESRKYGIQENGVCDRFRERV